jgi:hypothetical protein
LEPAAQQLAGEVLEWHYLGSMTRVVGAG